MKELLTATLLITGSALMFVAAVGLVRLPDILCRSHAVAKALTLGIFLVLFGLWMELDEAYTGLKIALAIMFQVVTIPVASHLVGLLAFQKNLPRWKPRPMDDHRTRQEDPGI